MIPEKIKTRQEIIAEQAEAAGYEGKFDGSVAQAYDAWAQAKGTQGKFDGSVVRSAEQAFATPAVEPETESEPENDGE